MQINLKLNGKLIRKRSQTTCLYPDFVRKHGCYSVKRGCETANCGLCTVFLDGKPVLSCSLRQPEPMEEKSPLWKVFRKKQKRSDPLWQIRERSSVASAIRDL